MRKVWQQLRREDKDAARGTMARLMRAGGLQGVGSRQAGAGSAIKRPLPIGFGQSPKPNVLWGFSDFSLPQQAP
jgi:hypothetical protein